MGIQDAGGIKGETVIQPRRRVAARHPDKDPDFLWCIHCERVYQYGDFRRAGSLELCPYANCHGAEVFAWDWEQVRQANPDYPEQPEPGVTYPLFGMGTRRVVLGGRA